MLATACGEAPVAVLPVPEHIALSELHLQLATGDTLRITAPAASSHGTPIQMPGTWSSSDPSIAEVDSTGLLVATGHGGALVTFEASGLLGHVDVQVERREMEWTDVAVGCGIRTVTLECWDWSADGLSTAQSVGGAAEFVQVDRSANHACAVTATLDLLCWGSNTHGQLGDGTTIARAASAAVVHEGRYLQVSVGPSHTCAVTAPAVAYCWGSDADGQVGIGGSTELCSGEPCRMRPTFVQVPGHVVAIVAGGTSDAGATCAVTNEGQAYCWGTHGILADGGGTAGEDVTEPQPIASAHRFMDIAVGGAHACAVTNGRRLYCWGANASGQRGTNDGIADVSTPTEVTVVDGPVEAVVAGSAHTCARLWHGGVQCWGSNTANQVSPAGGESPDVVELPQDVSGSRTFFDIAASDNRTCGITTSDEVVCWGDGITPLSVPETN